MKAETIFSLALVLFLVLADVTDAVPRVPSDKCTDIIKEAEALKLVAYIRRDMIWTIGYGNTFYENGKPVKRGDKITEARANELLKFFVTKFSTDVDSAVGSDVVLKQQQFDALVSFAYNVGMGTFKKSTLLEKVKADPNDKTIRDEFMKYNKVKGRVQGGLTKRRKTEADLYFS